MRFVRPPLLGRVVLGTGALERLGELVDDLGVERPELIGSASAFVDAHGRSEIPAALWDWLTDLAAPTSLPGAGADGLDLGHVAAPVAESPPPNPAPVSHTVVRGLLERAHVGAAPDLAVDVDAARGNDDACHD